MSDFIINPYRYAAAGGSSLLTSLVSHWKMDETSGTRNDSHGSNHLTASGTMGYVAGKIGNAGNFDNSSFLSIADNASLSLGTDTDFTIAFWIYQNANESGTIWNKSDNASLNNRESWIYISSDGEIEFTVGNGSSNGELFPGPDLATGQWNFVVCWHDVTANALYAQANNGSVVTQSWSGGTMDTAYALKLGERDSDVQLNAYLDSISYWKRILTSTERTALYNSGNGLNYPFS